MRQTIIDKIYEKKLIAIIRGVYGEDCRKLVAALAAGGIEMIEVTFDQDHPDTFEKTQQAISMINNDFENVIAGAGTVTTVDLVKKAYEAGAKYIISPNVSKKVIKKTKSLGMVSMPGAATPTEIFNAYALGADFVKVFPSSNLGGPAYIKAVRAPLNNIPLLAVGGVNEDNIADYIAVGAKGAGVGGNLVNKKLVQEGRFDEITELARKFCENANRGIEK